MYGHVYHILYMMQTKNCPQKNPTTMTFTIYLSKNIKKKHIQKRVVTELQDQGRTFP